MKFRIVVLIMLSFIVYTAVAQSTQRCVVKQYNQEQEKTPLSGVEVIVSNAGSAVSNTYGELTLTFRTLKPGDRVKLVSVNKTDFELYNKDVIDEWKISRDDTAFPIVLVNSEYFAQYKRNLKNISSDSYKSKYEQAVQELEDLRRSGKIKEDEFNRKYNELDSRYQEQLNNLDNYIDQFARIDISEVSVEEQRILNLVQTGKIDEAVKAYGELDISGKLRQARESKKALAEARNRIEKEEALQDEAIKALKEKQEHEIATLKLAGGKKNYDKVLSILRENAMADTTDFHAVWEYAKMADEEHEVKEAERFYLISLDNCKDDVYMTSTVQSALGYLNYKRGIYPNAYKYYHESLDNLVSLNNINPGAYRKKMAEVLNQIGILNNKTQDYEKRQNEISLLALEITMQLYEEDSISYREPLADIHNTLGNSYSDTINYKKSEYHFFKSLELYTLLFNEKPDTYRFPLAKTQRDIGILYYNIKEYSKSEYYLKKALENEKQLFDSNPDAYRWDLAEVQFHLGNLYYATLDFSEAEEFLIKAYDNWMWLHTYKNTYNSPLSYRRELSKSQRSLGRLYKAMHVYSKSLDYLFKAADGYYLLCIPHTEECLPSFEETVCEIIETIQDYTQTNDNNLVPLATDSIFYSPDDLYSMLADYQLQLGRLFYAMHNYDESEKYLILSSENGRQLYNHDPDSYKYALAMNYNMLCYVYMANYNYTKAEEYINMALNYMPDNTDLLDSKGELYIMQGNKDGALKVWNKIIELDPDFLENHNNSTTFYEKLKELGVI